MSLKFIYTRQQQQQKQQEQQEQHQKKKKIKQLNISSTMKQAHDVLITLEIHLKPLRHIIIHICLLVIQSLFTSLMLRRGVRRWDEYTIKDILLDVQNVYKCSS